MAKCNQLTSLPFKGKICVMRRTLLSAGYIMFLVNARPCVHNIL